MSQHRTQQFSPQILDSASAWFVEFNEGNVDASAREQFIQWLRTSPEHVRAYVQIAAHWEDAGALKRTQELTVDQLVALGRGEANVVPLHPITGSALPLVQNERPGGVERSTEEASARPAPALPIQSHLRTYRFMALAASALLAVLSLWVYSQRNLYTADTGERRSISLADGSTIDLNSRSRIRVNFDAHERNVELLEGQALFQVAKDATRPFIVHSNDTRVKAIGTQFDVYKKSEDTVISVVEGRVAVSTESARALETIDVSAERPKGVYAKEALPSDGEAMPGRQIQAHYPIELSAGEQVTVTPMAIKKPSMADISAATAWTQKQIIFRDTPLTEVVEEFNRYNTRKMSITDPAIEGVRISGAFSSSDPASLLRGLDAMGAVTIRETPRQIDISPR